MNNSITLTHENAVENLKSIKLVAVGNLIKTSTGYSPLLLTEDVVDMSVHEPTDKLFNTDDVGIVNSDEDIKSGKVGYYYYFENLDLHESILWISNTLEIGMHEIYMHLCNGPGAAVQARAEGYFVIDTSLECIGSDWQLEQPLIRDGRDDGGCECFLIPFNITVDELALAIKNHFGAICGVLINEDKEPSVYFIKDGYSHDNEYDYRHCISYIIDEKAIEGYYASLTYGEERQTIVKYLAKYTDPSYVPYPGEDVNMNIKWNAKELVEIAEKKSDEPRPLENRNADGTMQFVTEPFCSVQYFLKFPFELQVAACAKIVGVSVEEMLHKLRACSDPEMKF